MLSTASSVIRGIYSALVWDLIVNYNQQMSNIEQQ